MKKKTIFLSTLLCIFLIGVFLTVAGLIIGGHVFSVQWDTDPFPIGQHGIDQIDQDEHDIHSSDPYILSEQDAASIRGIEFQVNAQEARLVYGDHYGIETDGSCSYTTEIDDGIWRIKTKNPIASVKVLDHTLRIPVWGRHFLNHTYDHVYTVTIPSDTHLESARLSVAAGELSVSDKMSADSITLQVGAGEADIREIDAKKLDIKIGAGDGQIQKLQVTENCRIKIGVGNLTLGDEEYCKPADSQLNDLTGEVSMGDIEIMGRLTGNAKLTCQTGDIDMILDGTVLNYDFTSQASVGDIDIEGYDDLSGGDDLFEYAEGYLQDEQIYANIKLKCDLGDISVDFQS